MDSDFDILRLTDKFFTDYPIAIYRELMGKQKRAYNCLLFQSHYDYFICVPYRSEINHDNAFFFTESKRSVSHRSGLDYSKIIIISDLEYLDDVRPIIDNDEYRETLRNIERIKQEALLYVDDYVKIRHEEIEISNKQYRKKYRYSTLPYFHPELGL